jgi:hypothetical protein
MAWRKPSVRQTKLAHKSANYLRAISSAFSKFVGRQRCEKGPRLRLDREFQKPSFDEGRMQNIARGIVPAFLYQAGSVNSLILLICFQNNRLKAAWCPGRDRAADTAIFFDPGEALGTRDESSILGPTEGGEL